VTEDHCVVSIRHRQSNANGHEDYQNNYTQTGHCPPGREEGLREVLEDGGKLEHLPQPQSGDAHQEALYDEQHLVEAQWTLEVEILPLGGRLDNLQQGIRLDVAHYCQNGQEDVQYIYGQIHHSPSLVGGGRMVPDLREHTAGDSPRDR